MRIRLSVVWTGLNFPVWIQVEILHRHTGYQVSVKINAEKRWQNDDGSPSVALYLLRDDKKN